MLEFLKDWKEMEGKTVAKVCDNVLLFTDGTLANPRLDSDYDSPSFIEFADRIDREEAVALGIVAEWQVDREARMEAERERQRSYQEKEAKRREEKDRQDYERLKAKFA